ncbi:DUF1800 family protein, partial [bacterium]
NRQLLEMMVEFWSDHFNVYAWGEQWYETFPRHIYNIRKYALSTFPTLLMQMAQSGAMLGYLDNVENRRNAGNENYARELLELHTMGADEGYTETDVETARRCLSGWNVNMDENDEDWGQFKYYKDWHVGSGGSFLGTPIAPSYEMDQGVEVLTRLAAHPATARHIATKLCKRFLGDSVSEGAILNVERAYLRRGATSRRCSAPCSARTLSRSTPGRSTSGPSSTSSAPCERRTRRSPTPGRSAGAS